MDSEAMQKVIDIQAKYADTLMQKPNVVGVAVGREQREGKPDGPLCLVVLVNKKVPFEALSAADRLPDEIEGVTVDVQEIDQPQAQTDV